jgi:uncharacterized phage protein (TIGR02218 family)
MLTISPEFQAHLESGETTVAIFAKVERKDTQIFGFSTFDKSIDIEGVTYDPGLAIKSSQIPSRGNLSVDSIDIDGLIDSVEITADDLESGVWDGAEITMFLANWDDVTMGTIILRQGWWGKTNITQGQFNFDYESKTTRLNRIITKQYSEICRAKLGDTACAVVLTGFIFTGTVTSLVSARIFIDSTLTEEDGFFDNGFFSWTSGNNSGLDSEVFQSLATGQIELKLPQANAIQVGDQFQVIAGCNKTASVCISKFDNIERFRGEPFATGENQLVRWSSAG